MRQFINIVENAQEPNFRPIKNPSDQQITKMLQVAKEHRLRGIVFGNDFWLWDSFYAIHKDGAEALGIPYWPNGLDNRISVNNHDGDPVVDFSDETPARDLMTTRFKNSDVVFFNGGSYGLLSGRELAALLSEDRKQTIVENVQGGLDSITVERIIDSIPHADEDIQNNSWLGRAYHSTSGRPSELFIADLTTELDKLKAQLGEWIASPTPLIRGLRHPPQDSRPLGKHWTDYRYTALSHGHYFLHASVKPGMIDWMGTVMRRLSWIKEREFTLISGTVLNYDLEFNGKIIGRGRGEI